MHSHTTGSLAGHKALEDKQDVIKAYKHTVFDFFCIVMYRTCAITTYRVYWLNRAKKNLNIIPVQYDKVYHCTIMLTTFGF